MYSAVLLWRKCSHHRRGTTSGTTTVTSSPGLTIRKFSTYPTSGRSTDLYGDGRTTSGTPISHSSHASCSAGVSRLSTSMYTAITSSEIVVAYTSAAAVAFVMPLTGTTTV